MKCRKLRIILLSLTIIISSAFWVYAGPIPATDIDGNESTSGWKFNPQRVHWGSRYADYRYSSTDMEMAYASYITTAQNLWGPSISMLSHHPMASVSNVFYTSTNPSSSATAVTHYYYDSATAHITRWSIEINKSNFDGNSDAGKIRTLAHEIGHTYGLADLYDSSKSSQIMYGYYSTSKNVTSNDLAGMSVMTHTHSNHIFTSYVQYSSLQHKMVCNGCKGVRYWGHVFTNDVCTLCGYRR